jgi:hypothetical protein
LNAGIATKPRKKDEKMKKRDLEKVMALLGKEHSFSPTLNLVFETLLSGNFISPEKELEPGEIPVGKMDSFERALFTVCEGLKKSSSGFSSYSGVSEATKTGALARAVYAWLYADITCRLHEK